MENTSIIDTANDKIIANITHVGWFDGKVYGVAVSTDGKRAYFTIGFMPRLVSIIDTSKNERLTSTFVSSSVPFGDSTYTPRGIAVSPDSKKIYVVLYGVTYVWTDLGSYSIVAGGVSVMDATTNNVKYTIKTDSPLNGIAVSPNGKCIYATGDDGTVYVIDAVKNKVKKTITLGGSPVGVAVTPDNKNVYVADQQNVYVINTSTNNVIATIHLDGANVFGVAVNPKGKRVYVTNGNDAGSVYVIDTTTNKVTATVSAGRGTCGISVTPDGMKLYAVNSIDKTVSVISTNTNRVIATVPVNDKGPCSFGQFIASVPV